jgi:hypothetical protein
MSISSRVMCVNMYDVIVFVELGGNGKLVKRMVCVHVCVCVCH